MLKNKMGWKKANLFNQQYIMMASFCYMFLVVLENIKTMKNTRLGLVMKKKQFVDNSAMIVSIE